jgi:hypothetical protein
MMTLSRRRLSRERVESQPPPPLMVSQLINSNFNFEANFYIVADSPKKKIRKIERKLVPVVQKLSTDELMESNTYQRFSQCVDLIFENTEDLDLNAELGTYLPFLNKHLKIWFLKSYLIFESKYFNSH